MAIEFDKYWAGTEESLAQYAMNLALQLKHGYQSSNDDDDEEDNRPRLLNIQGSVAVISIRGALTNRDSGYGSYETTYPEIRQALIAAAVDPQVKSIVLDINSGGGAVTGVSDTANLIRKVDGIKPVHAFTDGMMCSAAYWLGCSARSVKATEMSEVGSIGVITTHVSFFRMYQEVGIDATVIRAGEFKALGHPMEQLSDKAKGVIQAQLDQMYGMFAGYVADRRSMSVDLFNQTAGEGRVFIGVKAVDAGLVDAITNFDKLISTLEEQNQASTPAYQRPGGARPFGASATAEAAAQVFAGGGIAFPGKSIQSDSNDSRGNPMKQALTEQQLAALAEGAGVAVNAADTPGAAQAGTGEVGAGAAAGADNAPTTETDPAAGTEAAAAAAQDHAPLVQVLQAQLAQANAQIVDLTVDLRAARSDLDKAQASNKGLREIAQASVDRMKVAMGMPSGVAAANDEALLAEHTQLRSSFEAKFKSGGVAAVAVAAPKEGAGSQPDPAHQARIQATRLK